MGIRPSTSLRYAQGERKSLLSLSFSFVLSVARRAESKHEQRSPSTSQLGKLYQRLLAFVWLPDGRMLNETIVCEGYARRFACIFTGPAQERASHSETVALPLASIFHVVPVGESCKSTPCSAN